jgi:hypothetical protein
MIVSVNLLPIAIVNGVHHFGIPERPCWAEFSFGDHQL